MKSFISSVILLGFLLLVSGILPASAQDPGAKPLEVKKHYVIKIDGDDIYVDIGNLDGARTGMILLVYKTGITITHPITGEKISGSVFLGQLNVKEVSDQFSIVNPEAEIKGKVQNGYEVKFRDEDLGKILEPKTVELPPTLKPAASPQATSGSSYAQDLKRYRGQNNRVSTRYQYAAGGSKEHYHLGEVDLMYRVFKLIYSIKFGIGLAEGQGRINTKNCDYNSTDSGTCPLAFNYGYTEVEFRLHDYFSFIPTYQLGMNNNGIGSGFSGKIRIGPELSTNLVLGGSYTQLIGGQSVIQFNHYFQERFKLESEVVWENYITGASVVRVALGPEVDLTDLLSLNFLIGYGGKDVDNMGITVGAGMAFNFRTGWFWSERAR